MTSQLILFREIIAIYSEKHIKQMQTLCEQEF
jgi:hypothetical protein